MIVLVYFFFFKHKTAYDMRISDWSSDVCSSDLPHQIMKNMAKVEKQRIGRNGLKAQHFNEDMDLAVARERFVQQPEGELHLVLFDPFADRQGNDVLPAIQLREQTGRAQV